MPRGAISWCLAASLMLSGCNAIPVQKETLVGPPVQYLRECTEPIKPERPIDNGKLVQYTKALQGALRLCNIDKAALREWAARVAP